jgi:hypothetical protein
MGLALVTYISFNGGLGLSLPFVLQARLYTMLHSLCWQWSTDQLYIMQAFEAALQIHVWAHSSVCFVHSVCTHCAWKMDLQYFHYLMAIFGLHRFKQDMCGHTIIYSFHSQWISLIFLLRTHVLEGFKVQTSILLQGHGQSYAMASSANCNSPVSSVTVHMLPLWRGKSWFKSDSLPPSKEEIFLHTGKIPKKPQTETNKLLKGLQNWWDGMIYYCWMLDKKLVLHCMYQKTWNGC